MNDIFFKYDSLVDFLSFCFTINTLFSFEKIHEWLSAKFNDEIKKCFDELVILKTSCETAFKNYNNSEKLTGFMRLNEIERIKKEIDSVKSSLKTALTAFHWIFSVAAFLSGISIILSGVFTEKTYLFSMLLLLPTVFFGFMIIWKQYRIPQKTQEIKLEIEAKTKEIKDKMELFELAINCNKPSSEDVLNRIKLKPLSVAPTSPAERE